MNATLEDEAGICMYWTWISQRLGAIRVFNAMSIAPVEFILPYAFKKYHLWQVKSTLKELLVSQDELKLNRHQPTIC